MGHPSSAMLDQLLDPLSRCLDQESSRKVSEFRMNSDIQKYLDGLAKKANEGLLTPKERGEYEALLVAADFVSILKLKARKQLKSFPG